MAKRFRRIRHRWRRIVAALAIYGVVLGLIGAGCADRLILFASTEPLDTSGLTRHEAHLPDGQTIEIWIARSRGAKCAPPQAYVLSFIGNAARAELTAPFFARDWGEHPVEVWAVNYPGYGGSSGHARLASIGPAALAAYDELRRNSGNKPIILEARSIGTAAALHVAVRRPVAACILHNPPPLRQLILGRYGWWNLWLVAGPLAMSVPADLDSVRNAPQVNVPGVIVVSEADGVVPPQYQKRVGDAFAGPKRIILSPGTGHTDRISGDAYKSYESGLDWVLDRATAQ